MYQLTGSHFFDVADNCYSCKMLLPWHFEHLLITQSKVSDLLADYIYLTTSPLTHAPTADHEFVLDNHNNRCHSSIAGIVYCDNLADCVCVGRDFSVRQELVPAVAVVDMTCLLPIDVDVSIGSQHTCRLQTISVVHYPASISVELGLHGQAYDIGESNIGLPHTYYLCGHHL